MGEVAAKTFEPVHRLECRFQAVHSVVGTDPAEIVRSYRGQQVQPEVGGRRSMSEHGLRVLLEVVGRKHVIFYRHKRLEEAPCAACDQSEGSSVGDGKRFGPGQLWWKTRPPREGRREHP